MQQPKPDAVNQSPETFLWGAATAAHQVEGNQNNDWSNWETSVAAKLAGTAETRLKDELPNWQEIAKEATNPDNYISGTAADHYNRYAEDFDLIKKIGLNAYRFSIEWSRIEPQPGEYNQSELDHYAQVVSELRKREIEPLVTLHHFTNPRWLEGHGGWHGKEVAEKFANFAEVVANNIGSAKYYCTINEPGSYLLMRYLGGGAWPEWPNMSFDPINGYKYLRNVINAHKLAEAKIRNINKDAQIGMANSIIDFQLGRKDPISWLFLKQLCFIPDFYLLNRLKNNIDYVGVNYYMRMLVKASLSHPANWAKRWDTKTSRRSDTGWELYPKGIYRVTQKVRKYGLPILITENGIADKNDKLRSQFIEEHVSEIMRSKEDGANIRGYFYWSLLDNYEWSEGFWPKFGLIEIDRKTQKRSLRESAKNINKIIKKYS